MEQIPKAGIYKITNLIPSEKGINKVYIGSSVNLKSRKWHHFNDLQRGKHGNSHLQRAYNKYGEDNFKWEIIEYVQFNKDREILKNNLLEREQCYLDTYILNNKIDDSRCYNLLPKAGSPKGRKLSKKHIESIVRSVKGKKRTAEEIEKSAKTRRKKVINLTTLKVFNSIGEAAKFYGLDGGGNISDTCKRTRKTSGGFYWAYYTEDLEILENIKKEIIEIDEVFNIKKREKHKKLGEINSKKVINLTTLKVFNSISEAERFYGLSNGSIHYALKNKNKTYGGFKWSYHTEDL